MKKIFQILLIAPIFLFACKKEHSASSVPSGKKYQVVFNVTNFAQQQGVFSNGRQLSRFRGNYALTDIGGYLDVLYLLCL